MNAVVVATLDPGSPALAGAMKGLDVEIVAVSELDARLAAGGVAGVVLVSDGLDSDVGVMLAGLLGDGAPPAIEVRTERWDGFSHALLSTVCRGVISGFGLRGAREAVRVLREEQP